ncbi:MAG: ankyrin repeat domain-containing protein [Anaerolineales bacterium]|nr:ankyrin repeat domain-containing protein [Anaerolineales bacterium]
MTDWLSEIKQLFQKQSPPKHDPPYLAAIAQDDPELLESARDWVHAEDIHPLLGLYWQLRDWDHKRAVVEILQDQSTPAIRDMMLDFLRVPLATGDERTELAQAIALGFINETYDRFQAYYNDRKLLARDVETVLLQHGLKAEPPPPPKKQTVTRLTPTPNLTPDQRLLASAQSGDTPALRQALREGANVNAVLAEGNTKGCSALMLAILNERFDAANILLDEGANIHFIRPQDDKDRNPTKGQTALWWAAGKGHMQLTERLVQMGADVNQPDYWGSTPAIEAAEDGYLPVLQFLFEQGADLHARIYDRRKGFHLAVDNGHISVVEFLLANGLDPNERGSGGYSPLMVAVSNNHAGMARLLLAHGAEVNARHTGSGIYAALKGWTPLVFAVHGGYSRMVRLLLDAGANPKLQMPATKGPHGESLPKRKIIEFVKGKRGESIARILREVGGEDGAGSL